jgi:molecular chaperone HscB
VVVASLSVSEAEGLHTALPSLNLQADDFTLLGVPPRFAIDLAALDARWKQLQRQVHPDRFATQGAAAQRVAMQWSVRINEAYQRLKDPLKRAAYWCELQGVAVNAENNTAMPAAFLMQQMEWREALDDADTEEALDALLHKTRQESRHLQSRLAESVDVQADPAAAVELVRSLMFIERFAQDVSVRLERY